MIALSQVKDLTLPDEAAPQFLDENEQLLNFPISAVILVTIIWVFASAALFVSYENDWNYG